MFVYSETMARWYGGIDEGWMENCYLAIHGVEFRKSAEFEEMREPPPGANFPWALERVGEFNKWIHDVKPNDDPRKPVLEAKILVVDNEPAIFIGTLDHLSERQIRALRRCITANEPKFYYGITKYNPPKRLW